MNMPNVTSHDLVDGHQALQSGGPEPVALYTDSHQIRHELVVHPSSAFSFALVYAFKPANVHKHTLVCNSSTKTAQPNQDLPLIHRVPFISM
jgi:hypothetical protein